MTERRTTRRRGASIPGLLVFVLIVGLGLVAMATALNHARAGHGLVGPDRSLAIAGLAMVVIGVVQARKLLRR